MITFMPKNRPRISLSVLLLLASLPFTRPNIFGEQFSNIGLALAVTAGFLALIRDRGRVAWVKGSGVMIVLLSLAVGWQATRPYLETAPLITGALTLILTLVSFALVISDRTRALHFAKGFVLVVVALCASATMTEIIWLLGSPGDGLITQVPISSTQTASLYFPFTTTSAQQSAFGIAFPRFTGLGREPGWMSMYGAVAWFMWNAVGRPSWWGRVVLVVGVLAPFSTAGFGIFVVILAYEVFLRPRPTKSMGFGFLRQAVGLAAIASAAWLAIVAPVFGLGAKAEQNASSLEGRSQSTEAGITAIRDLSLGEPTGLEASSLNIVASASLSGWPYALLIVLAILVPLFVNPARARASSVVAVIFLTLLLAQPPGGSISAYCLVLVALGAAATSAGGLVDSGALYALELPKDTRRYSADKRVRRDVLRYDGSRSHHTSSSD